jgi:hypothetical protein
VTHFSVAEEAKLARLKSVFGEPIVNMPVEGDAMRGFEIGLGLKKSRLWNLFLAAGVTVLTTSYSLLGWSLTTNASYAPKLHLQVAHLATSELIVQVILADDLHHTRTVANATFKVLPSLRGDGAIDSYWQRLWFSEGSQSLTALQQMVLRNALLVGLEHYLVTPSRPSPNEMDRAKLVVDFLANFLQAGTVLPPFDRSVDLPKSARGSVIGSEMKWYKWNSICSSVGQPHEATFTIEDEIKTVTMVVGEIETKCRGRCGTGCGQYGQWRHNQYTQECFNHDACHSTTGEQLGPCAEAFWAATASYTSAPDCTEQPIQHYQPPTTSSQI